MNEWMDGWIAANGIADSIDSIYSLCKNIVLVIQNVQFSAASAENGHSVLKYIATQITDFNEKFRANEQKCKLYDCSYVNKNRMRLLCK